MIKRKIMILSVLIVAISLSLTMVQASTNSSTNNISPKHKITNINDLNKVGYKSNQNLKAESNNINLSEIVSASSSDIYEPNNNITQASIVSGSMLLANISAADDCDIYMRKFTGTKAAIALRNIPTGCDYDLYLCDEFGNIMAYSETDGNKDEVIAYNLPQAGNYIIAVLPYIGYNASSNYSLEFIDNRIKTDGHAYASFGTPALWVFKAGQTSASKSFDLSSDSTIPNDAIVTSVTLSGNLNYTKSYYLEVSTLTSPWYRTALNGYYINSFALDTKLKTVWYARFCPLSIEGSGGASWIPYINFYYSYDPYVNYLLN